jgi:hypothetical protein
MQLAEPLLRAITEKAKHQPQPGSSAPTVGVSLQREEEEPARSQRDEHGQAGLGSGDPSPPWTVKREHDRCLGHRPCCHRNQVVAAGDRC